MRGLFITGTNTEVGKTYVAALIAQQLAAENRRVGVYKPVASGCSVHDGKLVADDAVALWHAAGEPGELARVCPQCFAAPLAPHLAASAENKSVDGKLLRTGFRYWQDNSDVVLVEGAGGLMSPLSDDDYNADLAAEFGLPLVVVAPNVLGTINATLQTLITASTFRDGLAVAGIVLNSNTDGRDDPSTKSNRQELEMRCVSPVLAAVDYNGGFDRVVDWWALVEGDV